MSISTVYFSAIFDESIGATTLVADVFDGAPYDVTHVWSLMRTDANGTRAVRLADGQTLIGDSGTGVYNLTVVDHEHALSGLVTYTFWVADETATNWERTASITPDTARSWLTFPILPQYSLELTDVGSYDAAWTPRDTILDIIDRDDPLPILGRFGLRSGRFSILTPNYTAGLAIIAAYKRIRTAYLRLPDPVDASMYHTVSNLRLSRLTPGASEWIIEGDYREVAAPTGPLLGTLGWSWDDVTALGGTWADLPSLFDTWADVQLGIEP